MSEAQFYDVMRAGLWIAVIISTPVLAVALISGLIIGLFQALTSIQEATLTFVPKLICIVAVFWITMGFMSEALVSLFKGTLVPLISGT